MSGAKFTDEFKRDAVAQVEDRGYSVREIAETLNAEGHLTDMDASDSKPTKTSHVAMSFSVGSKKSGQKLWAIPFLKSRRRTGTNSTYADLVLLL
jgi:hypothetical protein